MAEKLSWEEIKTRYPNEWIKLVDYDSDEYGNIIRGVVFHHCANKKQFVNEVLKKRTGKKYKSMAQVYTGEFKPLRSWETVDTEQKFKFLLDTGCGKTEISHRTAETLGFSAKNGIKKATVTALLGKIEGYVLKVPLLNVFNRTFKDFLIGVFDIAVTESSDQEIDGILGMDIISEFKLLLDRPNQKLEVVRN